MTTPPLSSLPDAEHRLAILDSFCVLDTPPDPAFDDIVAAAAAFCRAPIALISFVGQTRQWFKATVGTELKQTPIDQSICAHVVLSGAPLVIPDLTQDCCTEGNALVTGPPHIRFYGGYPLKTAEGEVLGALAVIDTEPRPEGLSDVELTGLAALARQVMRLLDLYRDTVAHAGDLAAQRDLSAAALRRARRAEIAEQTAANEHARQLIAGAAGGIGTFELDVWSNALKASPEMCRILGLPSIEMMELGDWISVIHPDDLASLPTPAARQSGNASPTLQYRILRDHDEAERWILRRARFERDDTGRVFRMIGTIQDVTAEKVAISRLSALLTLGDELRDAQTRQDALQAACRAMGGLIGVHRVGFQHANVRDETYAVEHVWHAPDVSVLPQAFSFQDFPRSTGFLREGGLCALNDLTTTAWLEEERTAHQAIDVAAQVLVPLMAGGELMGCLFVHHNTPRDWTLEETTFIQAAADRLFAALALLDAEARQATINHEILHRLKNTLALVQALAHQGLRDVQDREAVRAFTARLVALSSAHDALGQQGWHSTDLHSLVTEVCSRVGHADRMHFSGDLVRLGSDTVTTLSMVFHELTTNAVKYGALSVPNGSVAVRWTIEGSGDQRDMVLRWSETGGPEVRAPEKRGFGLKILENGLGPRSRMQLSYEPNGLQGELRASIASLTDT